MHAHYPASPEASAGAMGVMETSTVPHRMH